MQPCGQDDGKGRKKMLRLDLNVLWTIINLLITYGIVRLFLFKPVKKVLEARQAEIDGQYQEAQTARDTAERLKSEYEEALKDASKEKLQIISEARQKAGGEYEKILSDAKKQAQQIVEDADRMAEREQQKRMQQAQEQITELVVAATAKLMASRQNAEADRELYNQFIAKTGEKCD